MKDIPGLSQRSNSIVESILDKYPHMRPIVLFGSRAKGNYREGSDIDLAVKGECPKDDLGRMLLDFDESYLPYTVDVVRYATIMNDALKEHIDRVGIAIMEV